MYKKMAGKGSKNYFGFVLMLVLLMFGSIIKVSGDECCQTCVELCGCVGCPRTNYTCLLRCFKKCPFLCMSTLIRLLAVFTLYTYFLLLIHNLWISDIVLINVCVYVFQVIRTSMGKKQNI